MRDVLRRLRAVLTPQVLALLAAALALLVLTGMRSENAGGTTQLERRVAKTLSAVEGAGRVRVVISTRQTQTSSALSGGSAQEIPSGAIAVAEGASDPLVNMRLTQALCALLGLPSSAVTVISGMGGE